MAARTSDGCPMVAESAAALATLIIEPPLNPRYCYDPTEPMADRTEVLASLMQSLVNDSICGPPK